MKILITLCLSFVVICTLSAQDRFTIIDEKLEQLAKNYPGINEQVEISTNNTTVQEYLKAIGIANAINVNVDPGLDIKLSNNFSKVSAKEVFLFLCKRYDLEILFFGPIITFTKYSPPAKPISERIANQKRLKISYNKTADLLSYELASDTLANVAKEITKLSEKNIVFSPELTGKVVSGFMQNANFVSALEKLAFSNDMRMNKTADGFYIFEKKQHTSASVSVGEGQNTLRSLNAGQSNPYFNVKDGLISMDVQNVSINEIVASVSKELGKNYFLFTDLKGNATLKIDEAPYEEFLKLLFNGSDLTFKRDGETYLFGDRNLEGLRQSKLITLRNRTIEKIVDFIPAELKKGIDIKVFEDLNGLIVSGSEPKINELENFLRQIDIIVPMIHIEVIIADVRKSNSLSAGISAGLGTTVSPATNGTLLPNYNISLNSQTINSLIKGINGFGVINLGAVTPNFYLNLKAMESSGILKLRSTPQIATLNGHEAKLSIGQTQYYLEISNNVIGSQNPQNIISQNYKPVNADLSVSIDPQVSGDEQITMTINVNQSSFTERITETAPPGSINRDFQSLVRVKNGEMIMLGGLEEKQINDSGSGLPFLARVPILKWIFGNRTKGKSENKLTIFIRPIVIYN